MMSRKHYKAIAEAIRKAKYDSQTLDGEPLEFLVGYLNEIFIEDNPNFNPSRFEGACGIGTLYSIAESMK